MGFGFEGDSGHDYEYDYEHEHERKGYIVGVKNQDVSQDAAQMGAKAADDAGELIRKTLWERGLCNILVMTGAVMSLVLSKLVEAKGIDWTKVTGFHTAEFVGLPATNPATARAFLKKRLTDKVRFRAFHFILGDAKDVHSERRRMAGQLQLHPLDVAILEMGENGALAANDPPADFQADEPFVLVQLDPHTRQQQVNEKRFATLDDVPHYALTMTVPWIVSARNIVCCAGGVRQAQAVKDAAEGEVTAYVPASILQRHSGVKLYLDINAASLLASRKK